MVVCFVWLLICPQGRRQPDTVMQKTASVCKGACKNMDSYRVTFDRVARPEAVEREQTANCPMEKGPERAYQRGESCSCVPSGFLGVFC